MGCFALFGMSKTLWKPQLICEETRPKSLRIRQVARTVMQEAATPTPSRPKPPGTVNRNRHKPPLKTALSCAVSHITEYCFQFFGEEKKTNTIIPQNPLGRVIVRKKP